MWFLMMICYVLVFFVINGIVVFLSLTELMGENPMFLDGNLKRKKKEERKKEEQSDDP